MRKDTGAVYFFFNDTATTEIYTLSLHDALPIYSSAGIGYFDRDVRAGRHREMVGRERLVRREVLRLDRKSTRLNSSHANISYAVFCLKKKQNLFAQAPTSLVFLSFAPCSVLFSA